MASLRHQLFHAAKLQGLVREQHGTETKLLWEAKPMLGKSSKDELVTKELRLVKDLLLHVVYYLCEYQHIWCQLLWQVTVQNLS